jgi:hypothetical protein
MHIFNIGPRSYFCLRRPKKSFAAFFPHLMGLCLPLFGQPSTLRAWGSNAKAFSCPYKKWRCVGETISHVAVAFAAWKTKAQVHKLWGPFLETLQASSFA